MIKDLVLNEELDRNAMTNVRGGWFAPGMAMAAVVRAGVLPCGPAPRYRTRGGVRATRAAGEWRSVDQGPRRVRPPGSKRGGGRGREEVARAGRRIHCGYTNKTGYGELP